MQVRNLPSGSDGFYPGSLERDLRSERALLCPLAEMYVEGVSTRKVARITGQLCGFDLSSSQVSRSTAELDSELEAWRNRQLGETPYLILDARYEKVRCKGQVLRCAVLVALGITARGKRSVLGVSVSLSEAEPHWRRSTRRRHRRLVAIARRSAMPAAADWGRMCARRDGELVDAEYSLETGVVEFFEGVPLAGSREG